MNQNATALTVRDIERVRDFWNADWRGVPFIKDVPFGTPEFFRRYTEFRYGSEWHLNDLVPLINTMASRFLRSVQG